MNKKGFTLVEIIGVITLIALITIISLPPIINQINKRKVAIEDSVKDVIHAGAQLYISNNKGTFEDQTRICLKIQDLVDNDYLDDTIFMHNNVNNSMYIIIKRPSGDYDLAQTCEEGDPVYEELDFTGV